MTFPARLRVVNRPQPGRDLLESIKGFLIGNVLAGETIPLPWSVEEGSLTTISSASEPGWSFGEDGPQPSRVIINGSESAAGKTERRKSLRSFIGISSYAIDKSHTSTRGHGWTQISTVSFLFSIRR
jgi:hypothetical protein